MDKIKSHDLKIKKNHLQKQSRPVKKTFLSEKENPN